MSDNLPARDSVAEAPIIENTTEIEVRDFDAVDDDHPLVQYAGERAKQTDVSGGGQFIAQEIYDHDKAWVREWLQNHETACIRAAKLLVKLSDQYENDWLTLTKWVDNDTGETVVGPNQKNKMLADYGGDAAGITKIEVPRPIEEVIEAARSLGYDPTIVWDIYRDERKITTEDNGIGMTPREFYEAFESPFASGSGVDGNTGGQFGVGSESVRIVYGDEGGAEVESRSRRPGGHEGYRGYTYSGGATALPGEVDDDFRGTRFHIPVKDGFQLTKLQSWVEHYAQGLRIPLLYREHDAGSTPVEEEYEATVFTDDFGEPPVVIERPGEFSVVAGPDVIDTGYKADDEDTFLVSMPIDRNTSASVSTLWEVVVQIHDEQGLIVSGPHRGEYRTDVDDLHEDDVVLPEPTGDRDRLSRDSKSKEFWRYVQEVVTEQELEQVSDVADRMKEADHPADAIRGEESDWTLFSDMVSYHGHYNVTERQRKFLDFLDTADSFPDFEEETAKKVYNLFTKVELCNSGPVRSSKKSGRRQRTLGRILSENDPEDVYMAASTGGKFTQRFKVARNTNSDSEVIVIDGASRYDKYSDLFGFDVLKEIPLTKPGDDESHDFDVPNSIHEENKKTSTTNRSKSDSIEERTLKIRNDDDNSSIDIRLTIEKVQKRLERGRNFGNGKSKLVLFTSSQDTENISDHYGMAKYAAIASVSKTEFDKLADYDDVMTYEEFTEWSKSTLIATTEGAKTPDELVEDGVMTVLIYRQRGDRFQVQLLSDEKAELRQHYLDDIRDQYSWTRYLDNYDGGLHGDDESDVDDDEKHETRMAVVGPVVMNRAQWAFDQMDLSGPEFTCLKLGGRYFDYRTPAEWYTLTQSQSRYELMVNTPNWDDDSVVYDKMTGRISEEKKQMFLGLHDRGINPAEYNSGELRDLIGGLD